jgi:hypothetical protein
MVADRKLNRDIRPAEKTIQQPACREMPEARSERRCVPEYVFTVQINRNRESS